MAWELPVANLELPPVGPKVARCIKIIDLGTTKNITYNTLNRKLMITHELPTTKMEKDGRPFAISGFYNQVLGERSNLRKMLDSWLGKMSEKEIETFNPLSLLGKPSFINVVHNEGYANIGSIMPIPDGVTCPPAINEIHSFSFYDFKQEEFDKLSDKMQERLKQSFEGKARFGNQEETQNLEMEKPKTEYSNVFMEVDAMDSDIRSIIMTQLNIVKNWRDLTDSECIQILEEFKK